MVNSTSRITIRSAPAAVGALFFAAGLSFASPETLGIVIQARGANLGNAAVSPGASLYSGDRLSTDAHGALTFRAGTSTIYLAKATLVMVQEAASKSTDARRSVRAELNAGTIAFSIQPAAPVEISAIGASICALADTAALGQVSVLSRNTFEIHARRGSFKISYLDDSETIPQGKSYRVELDAPEDASDVKIKTRPLPARKRKRIALYAVGGAGTAGAIWTILKLCESPYSL
jgi:hypothetical protein